jgi:hypothetical protein
MEVLTMDLQERVINNTQPVLLPESPTESQRRQVLEAFDPHQHRNTGHSAPPPGPLQHQGPQPRPQEPSEAAPVQHRIVCKRRTAAELKQRAAELLHKADVRKAEEDAQRAKKEAVLKVSVFTCLLFRFRLLTVA